MFAVSQVCLQQIKMIALLNTCTYNAQRIKAIILYRPNTFCKLTETNSAQLTASCCLFSEANIVFLNEIAHECYTFYKQNIINKYLQTFRTALSCFKLSKACNVYTKYVGGIIMCIGKCISQKCFDIYIRTTIINLLLRDLEQDKMDFQDQPHPLKQTYFRRKKGLL